ncbi:MAG: hypothetical protein ACRDXX_19700 [Stackebrandtia sp.]
MNDVWPIVLTGVAGLLVGGVVSMLKEGRKVAAIVVGVLAGLALAGAVAWWWPQG